MKCRRGELLISGGEHARQVDAYERVEIQEVERVGADIGQFADFVAADGSASIDIGVVVAAAVESVVDAASLKRAFPVPPKAVVLIPPPFWYRCWSRR